jgi:hypothetical protein
VKGGGGVKVPQNAHEILEKHKMYRKVRLPKDVVGDLFKDEEQERRYDDVGHCCDRNQVDETCPCVVCVCVCVCV